MSYYLFRANVSDFPPLFIEGDIEWESFQELMCSFDNAKGWAPLSLTILNEGVEDDDLKDIWADKLPDIVDFNCTGRLIVSARAKDLISDFCSDEVEFLELSYGKREYYLLHVKVVVDALDESRSAITRFSNGDIMKIDEYCFCSEKVTGFHVFREKKCGEDIFISDCLLSLLSANNVTGFELKEVSNKGGREGVQNVQ